MSVRRPVRKSTAREEELCQIGIILGLISRHTGSTALEPRTDGIVGLNKRYGNDGGEADERAPRDVVGVVGILPSEIRLLPERQTQGQQVLVHPCDIPMCFRPDRFQGLARECLASRSKICPLFRLHVIENIDHTGSEHHLCPKPFVEKAHHRRAPRDR
jgi:hypothetical protein